MRKEFSIPIIGVIEPACDAAAKVTKSKHICVIGTQATVHSHAYSDYINRQYPDMTVSGIGCPLFVPLIENGFREDDPITKMTVEPYLSSIRNTDIDTLILGCTHYPFLSGIIHETLPDVRLIDIGVALSEVVGRTLTLPHNISDNFVEYCFSDRETGFKRFDAEHLKDLPNGPIKSINIESF